MALAAARQLDRAAGPVVALSTAHPSKFGAFVSDVLGFEPEPAPVIRALGDQPERLTIIDNTAEAALAAVKGFAN
ncbi:threonine synthase [compost metagenome]